MVTISIDLPAMYADHHVLQVRNLLMEILGVESVYASSAFKMVEIQYHEDQTSETEIRSKLDKYGYLDEFTTVIEANADDEMQTRRESFRQTAEFGQKVKAIGFTHHVNADDYPVRHCPGIGAINLKDID